MNRRAFSLLVVALFTLCACGTRHAAGDAAPPDPPSASPDQQSRILTDPAQLCGSGYGLTFHNTVTRAKGAPSARRAATRWVLPGETVREAAATPGRRLYAYGHGEEVRQVVTIERMHPSGLWLISRSTGCLTRLDPRGPDCGDVVSFHGTTYRRPADKGPGLTEGIGVGRPFGQGSLPGCADISEYAGKGEHLVGPLAPVTVYQQNEAPASDIVITSPLPGPRLYESPALQASAGQRPSVQSCHADHTRLDVASTGSTMSQPFADISITNTGAAPCLLKGYPQILAAGHRGFPDQHAPTVHLAIAVRHRIYERVDSGPHQVLVPPRHHVFFSVGTADAYDGPLFTLTRLTVILPGTHSPKVLAVGLLANAPPGRKIPVGITAINRSPYP